MTQSAAQEPSNLVRRLRNFFIDYDKSQLPDEAEPMPGLRVKDLREAADRIEALEALLRQHVCNVRTELSVGECVDAEKCACSCGLLLTETSALEAAAAQPREAELVKACREVMSTDAATPRGDAAEARLSIALAAYDTPAKDERREEAK